MDELDCWRYECWVRMPSTLSVSKLDFCHFGIAHDELENDEHVPIGKRRENFSVRWPRGVHTRTHNEMRDELSLAPEFIKNWKRAKRWDRMIRWLLPKKKWRLFYEKQEQFIENSLRNKQETGVRGLIERQRLELWIGSTARTFFALLILVVILGWLNWFSQIQLFLKA